MTPRRHDFGPTSRSDDESYFNRYGEEERRRGRPKSVSPRRGGPEKAGAPPMQWRGPRLLRCRASAYRLQILLGPPPRIRAFSGPSRGHWLLTHALRHFGHLAGELEVDQFQKLNGIDGFEEQGRQFARGQDVDSVLDVVNQHS